MGEATATISHAAATGIEATVLKRLRGAVLRTLDEMERLYVVLRYAEEMSAAEVGAVLSMSPVEIEGLNARVVAKLRHAADA
jgi:DNA-directed RNA polymerase specialized sigma subunit